MPRVLIIEDDLITAREIGAELQRYGLEVDLCDSGTSGFERARDGGYDAITLDRMLPGLDGLTLVTQLREAGIHTPVLMISALSDADERVRGLRAGGDDYLTKPFNPDEMAARVEVLLRRHAQTSRSLHLQVYDLELDVIQREARRGGVLLDLMPTEFKLLEYLVRHCGQVLTRTMIFEAVWGYHFDPGTNVIEVHIGRLRKKLDAPDRSSLIHTMRGVGYILNLADLWRVSTVRLLPIYGALFAIWSVLLIGVVQWDTHAYLSNVVDEILAQRMRYLLEIDRERLPDVMTATSRVDRQDVMLYGLFDVSGRYLSGNIERAPDDVIPDGIVRALPDGVLRRGDTQPTRARGLAIRVNANEMMVLARSTGVVDQVSTIIRRSLLWGLSLTIIPGVIGGLWLARRPLRRVRAMEAAVQPIMRGNLRERLPVSQRRDELDLLAGIVNTMLDEIERLMSEVKGVCDSIAHDLRTPLTRVRTQLHRLQRDVAADDSRALVVGRAIDDVDALLERFRALLRISELEDMHRRAGFADFDLGETLRNVREIFAPLAEDKQIRFTVDAAADVPLIHGDANLLLEALSNIIDNAIKFTPRGGTVWVRMSGQLQGPRIDVTDSGPGIHHSERGAVLQRFYRGNSSNQGVSGTGLGLSIVAAVIKLHGFRLEIDDDAGGGARISLLCWRDLTAVAGR